MGVSRQTAASGCAGAGRRGPLRRGQPPAQAGEGHAARRRGSRLRGAVLGTSRSASRPRRACRRARAREPSRARGCQARRRRPRDREVRRRGPSRGALRAGERRAVASTSKVARIPGGGWRLGRGRGPTERRSAPDPRAPARRVSGFSKSPYAELLPDEGRLRGVHGRCLRDSSREWAWSRARDDRQRPGCRSGEFNALLESEGVRHVHAALAPGRTARWAPDRTLARE